jgi:hypothetical protein
MSAWLIVPSDAASADPTRLALRPRAFTLPISRNGVPDGQGEGADPLGHGLGIDALDGAATGDAAGVAAADERARAIVARVAII